MTTAAPLSAQLRAATAAAHQQLEAHPFSALLVRGTLSATGYRRYLQGLVAIYDRMETALWQQRNHPLLKNFYDVDLLRSAALAADLKHHGVRPAVNAEPPVAMRFAHWAQSMPVALIAAAYVRYFGDLGGGQIFLQACQKQWNKPPDDVTGLQFYVFAVPVDVLRARLRGAIDTCPLDPAVQTLVIDSAVEVFGDHLAWFDELLATLHTNP